MRSINLAWLNSNAKRKVIKFGGEENYAKKNAEETNTYTKYDKEPSTNEKHEGQFRNICGSGYSKEKANSNGSSKYNNNKLEQCNLWYKIAKAIKYNRYILQCSQKECAKTAGISDGNWANYENAKYASYTSGPTLKQMKTLSKIADALCINYIDLFKDYPNKIDGIDYCKILKIKRRNKWGH